MARFYVGQRVRVVCPESTEHGKETTVTRINTKGVHYRRSYIGTEVDLTIKMGAPKGMRLCVFEDHELEPIIDPGHQVISWEEMAGLWTPEKVGA